MLKVYILPVCNQSQRQKKITITSGDSNEEMPQQRPPETSTAKDGSSALTQARSPLLAVLIPTVGLLRQSRRFHFPWHSETQRAAWRQDSPPTPLSCFSDVTGDFM